MNSAVDEEHADGLASKHPSMWTQGEEGTWTDTGPLSYYAPELIAACRAEHGPTLKTYHTHTHKQNRDYE